MALPDFELRHLAALVAVAEEGSFGRAATALGYTQSAVSQQVAALEKAVALPLFDRPKGPRAPELTAAGEVLLAHARDLLARAERAGDELDRLRRGITGHLRVGTFQSVSANVLPLVIGRMRRELPEVEVQLRETDDQEILLAGLDDDTLDLAFTVDVEPAGDYAVTTIGLDPFVVLAPRADGLGTTVTVDEVDSHPIIGQPATNVCQLLIEERLQALGVRPDYVFRSMDNGAVQGMVRSGMGWAIMPTLAVDATDPGVSVADLEPPIAPRTIQLARRSTRTLPPAADRFTEIVLDVCVDLLYTPTPN